MHALLFMIDSRHTALTVAYVVGMGLVSIGWVLRRSVRVPQHLSLFRSRRSHGQCLAAYGQLLR